MSPECIGEIQRSPWEYFGRFYFGAITYYQQTLGYLVRTAKSEQVFMGNGYAGDMGDEDPRGFVQSLSIPETEKKKILVGISEDFLEWSNRGVHVGFQAIQSF